VEKYLPVLVIVSLTGIKSLSDPENGNRCISALCFLFGITGFQSERKKFCRCAPDFPLQERERSERKWEVKYCCAITQTVRSSCGRSGSIVLEFGFQAGSLVTRYMLAQMHTHT
jgi:hypothetical protein